MNCDYAEKISLLIDGELPVTEARELERHLLRCTDCQALRVDFLSLRQQISDYTPTLDPAVQRQALARILGGSNGEAASRASRTFGLGLQWTFGRAAWAFASLLLIALVIGIVTYRNLNFKKTPEVTTAQSPSPKVALPERVPANDVGSNDQHVAQQSTSPSIPAQPKKIAQPKHNRRFESAVQSSVIAVSRTNPTEDSLPAVRSADAETLTAMHFEKSELLLRAFRNVRLNEPGVVAEVGYERTKAQQLVYQNMMLRREADASGDVQIATLLESLEPILLDIANLPDRPADDDIRVIKERVERKNIVALLQVNSAALARALD